MKHEKGLNIISEILMGMGIMIASIVFFLAVSQLIGSKEREITKNVEKIILEEIQNRVDEARGQRGEFIIQYYMKPKLAAYVMKGNGSILMLKSPRKEEFERAKVPGFKILDFEIRDEDFICIKKLEDDTLTFEGGKCKELGISENFCSDLKCVDNVCTPNLGERCDSPDCKCEKDTFCAPNYRNKGCLDEKGCVLEQCIGILEEAEMCQFDWECKEPLTCKPSRTGEKGCCLKDDIFDGVQCKKGGIGDPCERNEECSQDLRCNPTHDTFKQYPKACCPGGKGWNGTECVLIKTFNIVYVPIGYNENTYSSYLSAAKAAYRNFLKVSPAKECKAPETRVRAIYVNLSDCNFPSCGGHCGDCTSKAVQCARKMQSKLGIKVHIAAGITRSGLGGFAGGCAGTGIGRNGGIGGSSSNPSPRIVNHEIGHSLGLSHLSGCDSPGGACMGVNSADCREPGKRSFLMTYCPSPNRYGPAGYKYIKTSARNGMAEFLEGCGNATQR